MSELIRSGISGVFHQHDSAAWLAQESATSHRPAGTRRIIERGRHFRNRPLLGAKHEAEIHILTEPHDVVRSPSIVEQVAMNAGGKISLEL